MLSFLVPLSIGGWGGVNNSLGGLSWLACKANVLYSNCQLVKHERSATCYSTVSYMSQTCDRKRFTISGQLAADWHELMIQQHSMWPSVACISKKFDLQFAANRHTIAPISHNKFSLHSSYIWATVFTHCCQFTSVWRITGKIIRTLITVTFACTHNSHFLQF